MEIQAALGSDIAMVLDECPPYPCEHEYAARSLEMTARWAQRCKDGGRHKRVQHAAARRLAFRHRPGRNICRSAAGERGGDGAIGFDGYAIGGVSVGEPEPEMMQAVEWSEPFLPNDKPRYAMGLGTPPQLLELIARGVDMFDCVLPTRLARNGTAFTAGGTLNLKNAEFTLQKGPIEEGCACPACREFTRGYMRHLIKAEEILGLRLITLHNLHFYLEPDERARDVRSKRVISTDFGAILWRDIESQPRTNRLSAPARCGAAAASPCENFVAASASTFCGPRYLSPS